MYIHWGAIDLHVIFAHSSARSKVQMQNPAHAAFIGICDILLGL